MADDPLQMQRVRIARDEVNRMGSVVLVFMGLLLGWLATGFVLLRTQHLPPLGIAAGVFALVASLLVYVNLPAWVHLGDEGLLVDSRGKKRYIGFGELEEATIFRATSGGKYFVGVELALRDGAPLRLPFGEDQFGASDRAQQLRDDVTARHAAFCKREEAMSTAAIERGDLSPTAWVARLRKLGAGGNAGPREAQVPIDRLLRIVLDVGAPATARASAAVAIAPELDAPTRARIEAAAAATASPKLRVALEVATKGDDAAAAEALAELDVEASGAKMQSAE